MVPIQLPQQLPVAGLQRRRSSLGSLALPRSSASPFIHPDTISPFLTSTSPAHINLASQSSHFLFHSPSSPAPSSPFSSSPQPMLRKPSSQPNLRQAAHQSTPTLPSARTSTSTSTSNSQQQPHSPITITNIHNRSSPRHPATQSDPRQRTHSVTSSIGSGIAQHQQHLFLLGRHSAQHRASVSTCAMTDDSLWDETDIDVEDAQGGINSLLMSTAATDPDDNEDDIMDCQPVDDDAPISRNQLGKQGDKSESCNSSVVGESSTGGGPMSLDTEHRPARPQVGAFGARMVRRKPVNRANLLPRPKAHLRVAAQLSTEDVSPDLLTESEVHRRFRSVPFVVPSPSSLLTAASPASNPSHSPLIPRTPSSPFGNPDRRPLLLPPPNRFPEQAGPDESLGTGEDSEDSSDSAQGETFDTLFRHDQSPQRPGADPADDSAEQRMAREIQKWKTFRGAGSAALPPFGISPGSPDPSPARQHGIHSHPYLNAAAASPCSSIGAGTLGRPTKRRFQDPDRFDCSPNSASFKRRAISPSASITGSSSCVGSPVLHCLQPTSSASPGTIHRDAKES